MIHGPALPNPNRDIEIVVFQWSTKHGHCYDCGLPAAFYLPTAYVNQTETPGRVEPPTPENKRCAVCAANEAADGETVRRIREETE